MEHTLTVSLSQFPKSIVDEDMIHAMAHWSSIFDHFPFVKNVKKRIQIFVIFNEISVWQPVFSLLK